MEPQKPDNSPGPGPEVVERQRVAKEQAAQRVRSWTVQNEMRGIRRRCIMDPRFCRSWCYKNLLEDCVRCSKNEREHSERDERTQISQRKSSGPVCRRISMRHYASSPRKERSGYERQEERDYKGLQRAQVAFHVWPAHQSRRSPGETSVRGPIVA